MLHTAIVLLTAAMLWLQTSVPVLAQVPAAAALPQTAIAGSLVNPAQAAISGNIVSVSGQPLSNITAQARNLLTAQVGGTAAASSTGQYSIVGLNPGYYVVEIVDPLGQVIGTSGFIMAPAGAVVAAAAVTAATGTLSAVTAATGIVATLGATAARAVTVAAATAGVAGVVVPVETPVASPSR